MKKKFAFAIAAVMLMATFAACNKAAPNAGTTANAPAAQTTQAPVAQTLVIGGSGPLTGDYATYGVSVKQGAQLAMKEINAAGGVNGVMFDVRMEDDQADPAMARRCGNEGFAWRCYERCMYRGFGRSKKRRHADAHALWLTERMCSV